MKKHANLCLPILTFLLSLLFSFNSHYSYSQGIALVEIDSASESFSTFITTKTSTTIDVDDQIAKTTTSQTFKNNLGKPLKFNYVFPLRETSAATLIRWKYKGVWDTASLTASPQDTTTSDSRSGKTAYKPGALAEFMGETPLYFPIEFDITAGESIEIELEYMELLAYKNRIVSLSYPCKYTLIQKEIDTVEFNVNISSYREIYRLESPSHSSASVVNNGHSAKLNYSDHKVGLNDNFEVLYELEPDLNGLHTLSTFYPDSLQRCDSLNGFFTLIIEPNPNSEVIAKDFVLIIDRSGSMQGKKISDAKAVASFILDNLNAEDKFGLVSFNDQISLFSNGLKSNTPTNINSAKYWVDQLAAVNTTNIEGGFRQGIPLFNGTADKRAKVVVFITDGHPNVGIRTVDPMVNLVKDLIRRSNHDVTVNCFGVGASLNHEMLSKLADNTSGTAVFFDDQDFYTTMVDFYNVIRNPVLLNTSISFSPNIVSEVYPKRLPNLYKGHQLVINGRYDQPGQTKITLKGTAFGEEVKYEYNTILTDSLIEKNHFLPKIWTKSKIDYLMEQYYLHNRRGPIAQNIHKEISFLSLCRGVVSPLTSFKDIPDNSGGGGTLDLEFVSTNNEIGLAVYPNPATGVVFIKVPDAFISASDLELVLFSSTGEEIARLMLSPKDGILEFDLKSLELKAGMYILELNGANQRSTGRLMVAE